MRIKKNIKTYVHAAAQLLLACAIIFNLGASGFHELTGHMSVQEQTCTEENEQDACHRYVYHQEQSRACNGSHEHIATAVKDCFSCKYVKERQPAAFLNPVQSDYCFSVASVQHYQKKIAILFSDPHYFYLRGPPALS